MGRQDVSVAADMTAVKTLRPVDYSPAQLDLIKRTVAADTSVDEFNLFVEVCKRVGLDPFRKQIYAIVYNKNNAEKRRMSIITGIDGFRAVAKRSGTYRPDDDETEFFYDDAEKNEATNPLGLVKAKVRCFQMDPRGEWYPVVGVAYWSEFAPIDEEWAWDESKGRRAPTGKMTLTGKWRDMPRQMLEKCAEAKAIRRGWPEDLSGVYAPEEMHQAYDLDLTASEVVDRHNTDEVRRKIGLGENTIMMVWNPGDPMVAVPVGEMHDRCEEWLKSATHSVEVTKWHERNQLGLKDYWTRAKGDALDVKAMMDARIALLQKQEEDQEQEDKGEADA